MHYVWMWQVEGYAKGSYYKVNYPKAITCSYENTAPENPPTVVKVKPIEGGMNKLRLKRRNLKSLTSEEGNAEEGNAGLL